MERQQTFHPGERFVQERTGESDMARRVGRGILDQIPARAAQFIERTSLLAAGSLEESGRVWASVLVGEAGFASAPNPSTLKLDKRALLLPDQDPFWSNARADQPVGLLIIDFATRQRFRVNGRAQVRGENAVVLSVQQAYGNCPKYIQKRKLQSLILDEGELQTRYGETLEPGAIEWIERADTAFVASAHPSHGADASHRGGMPGFLKVMDGQRIRIPDYPGNSLFNTLGNLESHPHAGLALLDFEQARVLQLSGRAKILWDQRESSINTGGTNRIWEVEVDRWRETIFPVRQLWSAVEFSPFNP